MNELNIQAKFATDLKPAVFTNFTNIKKNSNLKKGNVLFYAQTKIFCVCKVKDV